MLEDCGLAGDEDGNGKADCDDPACAGMAACQPECGNDEREAGEICDDGNKRDGDGCDSNCTVTACGNGVKTAGEACDDGNKLDGDGCDSNCAVTACGNGIVGGAEECDDGNLADGDGCNSDCTIAASVHAYIKASNTDANDEFGFRVALSADGSTLAVSTIREASAASGVGGNQSSNSAADSGAVYVFTRSGVRWTQQAYLKASNTGAGDLFGWSLAISADGATLAVGARGEDSAATGVDGDQLNDNAFGSGAAYVFTRSGATWSQQAYLKVSNTGAYDQFGVSLALSADGSTLAIGATGESSAATGIDGDQTDDSANGAGAVYVFTRSGATWSQQAYVKASNTGLRDAFGASVALSADGSTLAVGASDERSAATGVNGDQTDNSAGDAGAVYVFTRSGTAWSQQAYIKASNTGVADLFGASIALSGDGSTLAVASVLEDSAATGIDGDQTDDSAGDAGAVYVFTRSGTTWSQEAYVKASNTGAGDSFGFSVALSGDGSMLAVGAVLEDSAASAIGGNQADNSRPDSGAVYVFGRSGTTWSQISYIKASNTGVDDQFGGSVAVSSDGSTLAAGAVLEDSASTGVNNNQSNNLASNSGTVYVHR
jgi:cysteine-rich repeat protein